MQLYIPNGARAIIIDCLLILFPMFLINTVYVLCTIHISSWNPRVLCKNPMENLLDFLFFLSLLISETTPISLSRISTKSQARLNLTNGPANTNGPHIYFSNQLLLFIFTFCFLKSIRPLPRRCIRRIPTVLSYWFLDKKWRPPITFRAFWRA